MHVARGSTTAGRLTRSLPLGHLIPGLLVLVGIVVGIYFGISSLLSETQTVSPEHTSVTPVETSIPEVVQEIPVVETKAELEAVLTIQESTTKEPVLESEASAPKITLVQMEWNLKDSSIQVPPLGEEPYSGTSEKWSDGPLGLAGTTPERTTIIQEIIPQDFEDHLAESDGSYPLVIVAILHKEERGVIASFDQMINMKEFAKPEKTPEGLQPEFASRVFFSKDTGSSWVELSTPPVSDEAKYLGIAEARIAQIGNVYTLFVEVITHTEGKRSTTSTWWITTINNSPPAGT